MTTLFEFPTRQIANKFYDEIVNDGIFDRIASMDSKVTIIAVNDEQIERMAKYKSLASRYYNASFKEVTIVIGV